MTVTFAMVELPRLEWSGSSISTSSHVISFLKEAYLTYVLDIIIETPLIDSVHVVREFSEVFLSNQRACHQIVKSILY